MNYIHEYELRVLKSGKLSKRVYSIFIPYTEINVCEVCGKIGTPRRVTIRNDVWGWNRESKEDYVTEPKMGMLCVGCWNRVRTLVYREDKIDEIRSFIKKLERTIANERKQQNQNNGRTA